LLILLALSALAAFMPNEESNQWNLYSNIFDLIIIVGSLFVFYNTNNSGDNKDFIERYICLGIPVLIRTAVSTFPACIILACISFSVKTVGSFQKGDEFFFTYTIIFGLYYTWRLNSAFKIASQV
jgi:hypothetical protein